MSGRIEAKLKELGITLPSVPTLVANYVPFVRSGSLVFLSGQGPRQPEGGFFSGKVGSTVSIEQGYQHARLAGLQLIAVLRVAAGGELDRVRRIVKVLGMVNADPVFGEKGRHARSAIGVGSLPHQMTVEIEAIAELD